MQETKPPTPSLNNFSILLTDQEYSFNANGAMTQDLNKGVTNIVYNQINLPQEVYIDSPLAFAVNHYSYSAAGVKLHVEKKYQPISQISPIADNTLLTMGVMSNKSSTTVVSRLLLLLALVQLLASMMEW